MLWRKSMILATALLIAIACPCNAVRLKHRIRVTQQTRANGECPDEVTRNTKGQCIDKSNSALADESCCTVVDTCREQLIELIKSNEQRLRTYVNTCKLQQSDWILEKHGGGVTIPAEASDKLCSLECQSDAELSVELQPVDLESLRKDCSRPETEQELQILERYIPIVDTTDTAWKKCSETTPLPTTTTTTGTDLFEPVTELKSVFVIDVSGSMGRYTHIYKDSNLWFPLSRLDVVKEALTKVIQKLGEDHYFAILAFSSSTGLEKVRYMSHEWLQALPDNKAMAAQWIQNLRSRGSTPTKHAMAAAFQHFTGLEAVHLLGDGEPTDCTSLDECLDFIPSSGHGYLDIPIHTTLFTPGASEMDSAEARTFLMGIAAKTGGTFREPFPPLPIEQPTPSPNPTPGGDDSGDTSFCEFLCHSKSDCVSFPSLCTSCLICS